MPADFPTTRFDILVVGSGAAGLYGTLCLPPKYRVGLITKDTLKTGASDWAQGGIAAAIAPNDSPQFHLEDTLKAGAQLCDYSAVEFLVNEAPSAIDSLVKMGVAFDRKNSQLAMTLEAAHSHARVLHAADTTGRAIINTLTEKVLERPNVTILSQAVALKLWLDSLQKQCLGISVLYKSQIHWIRSSAVVLATGGGGQVYAQTTNPTVSTGDGVALAWRGGAVLKDLEFFQFHPTALIKHNAPHFLISEAVRGEGAHLIDHQGQRFTFEYHPKGELAPRDVVSRAIFSHLEKTAVDLAHGYVYLDLRPIESERILRRFPNILQVCRNWGIDVLKEPIPVAPAAHYWMGGICVNLKNETSIEGLYAIGETASTGVHGANRLASNSLLECLVFAAQLSKIEVSSPPVINPDKISVVRKKGEWGAEIELIKNINRNLPILLWKSAGICREKNLLETALDQVQDWREQLKYIDSSQYILDLEPGQQIVFDSHTAHTNLRICAETLNLLDIAYLILKSSLFRKESRGGHFRTDYPESSPQWRVHTLIYGNKSRTNQVESI
ncbi:L-aspartate oxidase [Cyanobacterium sp. uoEpiScrs1]|uniref:L-aspartate oxidase n=1 Tax=Cyanobacterium sp. uoEpiScrs1 TaxID=2976343 RepID=UPI00226A9AC0|nr:L-aspartate oxidase [Cyanobacterium sp. uoEpiScrs1]